MNITEEHFKTSTNKDPENDDLIRSNCEQAGEEGHIYCGWCKKCDKPIFMCGHILNIIENKT